MAETTRAVFTREFNYTSRIRNAGWCAKPSPKPQSFPREFIAAAISVGCAEAYEPKKPKPPKDT